MSSLLLRRACTGLFPTLSTQSCFRRASCRGHSGRRRGRLSLPWAFGAIHRPRTLTSTCASVGKGRGGSPWGTPPGGGGGNGSGRGPTPPDIDAIIRDIQKKKIYKKILRTIRKHETIVNIYMEWEL